MQESVEHADCRRVLGQEPAPLVEGPVAADPERDALVGRCHEPEQQLCTGVIERGEAKLVDDHGVRTEDLLDHLADGVVCEPSIQRLDKLGRGEVAHPLSRFDGGMAEGDEDVALAGAGRDSDRLQQIRQLLPCDVRVTSTKHPLFGTVLLARGFKRWKGELMLVVVLPDGSPGTLSVAATDLFGTERATELQTLVLSVDGVRRLQVLVESLSPAKRSAIRAKTRK